MKTKYPLPWKRVNTRIFAANGRVVCGLMIGDPDTMEGVADELQDMLDRAEVILESVNSVGPVVMENMRLLRGGKAK